MSERGITFLELIFTVLILVILATLAYPSYQHYLVQSKRKAAEIALNRGLYQLQNQPASEKLFEQTAQGLAYRFQITRKSADAFLLQAIPQGQQAQQDTQCGVLSIDSEGQLFANDNTEHACW
jgi:type IV pilus assembly protein PilE